jgi:hypothetical protein
MPGLKSVSTLPAILFLDRVSETIPAIPAHAGFCFGRTSAEESPISARKIAPGVNL